MGKRYFCDYCDRSFQDNLHNRKKHLNGLQHLKAKKVWYDMFRDAAAILLDEQNKRPCRKFLLTGQCDFGSNCRFSHMSERDLQELSIQVEGGENEPASRQKDLQSGTSRVSRSFPREEVRPHGASRTGHVLSERLAHSGTQATEPKQEAMFSGKKEEERRAREWPLETAELPEGHLEDWLEKRAKRLSSAPSIREEPIRTTVFQYPVGWPPMQELPPSLRAPPPGGWSLQSRVQWG